MPKTEEKPVLVSKTIQIDEQLWADFGAAARGKLRKIKDALPEALQDWIKNNSK